MFGRDWELKELKELDIPLKARPTGVRAFPHREDAVGERFKTDTQADSSTARTSG